MRCRKFLGGFKEEKLTVCQLQGGKEAWRFLCDTRWQVNESTFIPETELNKHNMIISVHAGTMYTILVCTKTALLSPRFYLSWNNAPFHTG